MFSSVINLYLNVFDHLESPVISFAIISMLNSTVDQLKDKNPTVALINDNSTFQFYE